MTYSRRAGTVALAALVLAACESSLGPDSVLEQQINDDVATVVADATLDDVAQMAINDLLIPAAAYGPITRSRTVEFFDEAGAPQNGFDPLLTDSIHILVSVSGTVERDLWSASIERTRDLSVSGLAGEETTRTWNGSGTGAVTGSRHLDGGATRSYDMTSSMTMTNVVVGIPRVDNPWPLSGSISRTVTVTVTQGDATRSHTRTVTVEFNGTQFAVMTMGDESWEIDLAARAGQRAHHPRGR